MGSPRVRRAGWLSTASPSPCFSFEWWFPSACSKGIFPCAPGGIGVAVIQGLAVSTMLTAKPWMTATPIPPGAYGKIPLEQADGNHHSKEKQGDGLAVESHPALRTRGLPM